MKRSQMIQAIANSIYNSDLPGEFSLEDAYNAAKFVLLEIECCGMLPPRRPLISNNELISYTQSWEEENNETK